VSRGKLRLGLIDACNLCGNLPADAADRRFLHGDLITQSLHRESVVPVLDALDSRPP